MIKILLTPPANSGLLTVQPQKTVAGFDSSNNRRTHRLSLDLAVFLRPVHGEALLFGRRYAGGLVPAGPVAGLSTRIMSALFAFDSVIRAQNPFQQEATS